jgi:hypothetical protein
MSNGALTIDLDAAETPRKESSSHTDVLKSILGVAPHLSLEFHSATHAGNSFSFEHLASLLPSTQSIDQSQSRPHTAPFPYPPFQGHEHPSVNNPAAAIGKTLLSMIRGGGQTSVGNPPQQAESDIDSEGAAAPHGGSTFNWRSMLGFKQAEPMQPSHLLSHVSENAAIVKSPDSDEVSQLVAESLNLSRAKASTQDKSFLLDIFKNKESDGSAKSLVVLKESSAGEQEKVDIKQSVAVQILQNSQSSTKSAGRPKTIKQKEAKASAETIQILKRPVEPTATSVAPGTSAPPSSKGDSSAVAMTMENFVFDVDEIMKVFFNTR